MRVLFRFRKYGPARYIAHLDLLRTVQRTLRRAGLPMEYSQGFNPHPLITFAQALSLGMESTGEYFEAAFEEGMDTEGAAKAFNSAAPEGIEAISARLMGEDEKNPMAAVAAAEYEFLCPEDMMGRVIGGAEELLSLKSYMYQKKSKTGVSLRDMRPMIFSCGPGEKGNLAAVLSCGQENLAPGEFFAAVCKLGGAEIAQAEAVRRDLLRRDGKGLVSLSERA